MGQQVLLKRQLVCFFRNFNFRSTPFWDTFKAASVKDRTEGDRFSYSFPHLWRFAWLDENFMTCNTKWKHWWVQGRCNISYSKGRGQILIFPPASSIWEWQNISQLWHFTTIYWASAISQHSAQMLNYKGEKRKPSIIIIHVGAC